MRVERTPEGMALPKVSRFVHRVFQIDSTHTPNQETLFLSFVRMKLLANK